MRLYEKSCITGGILSTIFLFIHNFKNISYFIHKKKQIFVSKNQSAFFIRLSTIQSDPASPESPVTEPEKYFYETNHQIPPAAS